jgi:hypothetical protein
LALAREWLVPGRKTKSLRLHETIRIVIFRIAGKLDPSNLNPHIPQLIRNPTEHYILHRVLVHLGIFGKMRGPFSELSNDQAYRP